MRKNKGSTLVEVLLSLAIGWVIFMAFLGAIAPVQSLSWDLSALHDRDSTLCLAPPLLCKWTAAAGNNCSKHESTCLRDGGMLHVKSDTDGSKGFPDGDLDESYESISIRHNGADLQIRSAGGSFQPVFRNVSTFEADTTDPLLLSVKLGAQTDKTLIRMPETSPRELSFQVYLWNRRPNLFEENP
ncbi:MAG: prepilin-type N-terminal cleavage/methylation domain-containing protein [Acidobacteriota bacterium]